MRRDSQRWRSWVTGLLAVGFSLGIAMAAAEALLRWVFHAAPLLDVDIYQLDSQGNLRMQPGARRRHVTRLWDVSIAIDRDGFRDRETPILSAAPPVLGMGDSFAFGWGVNLEDTYYYLLEQHLNRSRKLRIIKAGAPGTGTGDQWRLLETIGPQYRPQLIILSLFVGNDFTDVQMGGLAQFEVRGGLLVRKELQPASGPARWRQTLLRSSHLLQFLRAVQLASTPAPRGPGNATERHAGLAARDPWLWEFAKVHLREWPPETARGVRETLGYLEQFAAYGHREHTDFVLLVIPRSYQIYPEELRELQQAFELTDAQLDLDHPQRALEEWARSRGVRLLDLLPEFRRHARAHPGSKLYYYPDAHLNAAGHRFTAELLARFLENERLPRYP